MKKAFVILAISASLFPGWERTYRPSDWNNGSCVQETYDGGYIVVGCYDMAWVYGRGEVLVIKTDENGDTVWLKTHGGSNYEEAQSILQTPDGGYIIAGLTFSFGVGGADFYILRIDCLGEIEWTKTDGTTGWDVAGSLIKASDGGYMLAGYYNFGFAPHDPGKAWLLKIDDHGDTLWTRTYGVRNNDYAISVINSTDGGYIFAGRSDSSGVFSSADVYVVKTNAYGDTLWTRLYGGSDTEIGYGIVEVGDGGYVIAGITRSFGAGETDGYLIRINNYGDTLWTRTYGGIEEDGFKSMQMTLDSCLIIAGSTKELSTSYIWLLKTDTLGNEIWSRRFNIDRSSYGEYVSLTSDGGFIITGRHATNASPIAIDVDEVYLIKTDSLGYTLIEETTAEKPQSLALSAHPNPFNSAVTIAIETPSLSPPLAGEMSQAEGVRVEVFDLNGRRVAELIPPGPPLTRGEAEKSPLSKGVEEKSPLSKGDLGGLVWSPDETLPSGVYLVRAKIDSRLLSGAEASGGAAVKRIVYLK